MKDDLPDIHPSRTKRFVKRFRELREQRSKLDFELAGLAHEIRGEFPQGPSGDSQCRLWMLWHLEIASSTAAMLTRAARGFLLFPTEKEWTMIGGWSSIGFLLSFRQQDRRRVQRKAMSLAEERGSPISYTTVRNIAHTLGVRQNRRTGRPNRLQVEEDLGLLRAYVAERIKDGSLNPREMPPGVLEALKPTRLAAISDAIGD